MNSILSGGITYISFDKIISVIDSVKKIICNTHFVDFIFAKGLHLSPVYKRP